ncbi:MAG: radical SAM protein [Candidatus Lokiarchaeota archaeon]|nr:radical SAM protein [Candidatus Lokiarchaeota archaeon]
MSPFIVDNKITNKFVEAYTKTTYRIVGKNKHSAVKPCHWFEQRLMTGRDNRNCYKGVFGVKSHLCLQNTPSIPFCNHQCVFCWRDVESGALGNEFIVEPDDPGLIVEELIKQQQDIVKNHLPLKRYLENYEVMIDIIHFMLKSKERQNVNSMYEYIGASKTKIERGFTLLKNREFIRPTDATLQNFELDGDISCCLESREEIQELVDRELTTPEDIMNAHYEALTPMHAAISLDGEPFLYPRMSEYVEEFKKRHMTTFIVTNGTLPEKIEQLEVLPSQLYVTLPAYDEQSYKKICRPTIRGGWERLNKTLNLLQSLTCRTLIRLTAVKDNNINEQLIKKYAEIVKKAQPNFFEIKGFTLQAKALLIKERLKSDKEVQDFFPSYEYLENIALEFERISGFPLIYSNKVSRDFLFAVDWDKEKDLTIKNP